MDRGGNFTAGSGIGGERSDRFDFAYYINKPQYTEGLVGKHVGFGQIVEAVSIVKALVDVVRALVDVVTALKRAGWRKSTIIIMIFGGRLSLGVYFHFHFYFLGSVWLLRKLEFCFSYIFVAIKHYGVAKNEQRGLNLLDFGLFYLVDDGIFFFFFFFEI